MATVARLSSSVAPAISRRSLPALPARRIQVRPASLRTRAYNDGKSTEASSEFDSSALQAKLNETVTVLQNKWDEQEDKPAVVVLAFGAVMALIVANSVVESIDHIPLVNGFFELVGLGATGWFIYRYLLQGPDRKELFDNVNGFVAKVFGK